MHNDTDDNAPNNSAELVTDSSPVNFKINTTNDRARVSYVLNIEKKRLDDPEEINSVRVFLPSGVCAPFIRSDAWEKWTKEAYPMIELPGVK